MAKDIETKPTPLEDMSSYHIKECYPLADKIMRNIPVVDTKELSEELKKLYNHSGISKSINGHFHESSQRANDLDGNHVDQGKYVSDLFWNASYLDKGRVGILTVKDNKVKYKNINL